MQLTNFKKLFDDEIVKLKANSSSVPENHPIIRQFREAIWVFFFFPTIFILLSYNKNKYKNNIIFFWSFGLGVCQLSG